LLTEARAIAGTNTVINTGAIANTRAVI